MLDTKTFADVDDFIVSKLIPDDEVLRKALSRGTEAELPAINVSPAQGKMLSHMCKMQRAGRVLEIGTLAGYSTIWLARALPPDGKLITLEFESKHADVARKNFVDAKLDKVIEIRVGAAADTMREMIKAGEPPFDLIFIDANKEGNPEYFDLCLELSRPGTQIIADNIVRAGELIDPASPDPRVHGVREYVSKIAACPRVTSTVIQTVGSKGYDGFALSLVLA